MRVFHASVGADPSNFSSNYDLFKYVVKKRCHDKTEGRQSAPKRMLFNFIWSHECPAGGEKTGRTTIFHSFLRTKKLPCLYQLSSLAFSRFLPLFEISAVNNAEETLFSLRRLTSLFRRKTLDPILYFLFYFK